jgi:hypothetical protein
LQESLYFVSGVVYISENTLLPGEKILWVSFWGKNKKKGMKKGNVKEKGRKGKEKEKMESKGKKCKIGKS